MKVEKQDELLTRAAISLEKSKAEKDHQTYSENMWHMNFKAYPIFRSRDLLNGQPKMHSIKFIMTTITNHYRLSPYHYSNHSHGTSYSWNLVHLFLHHLFLIQQTDNWCTCNWSDMIDHLTYMVCNYKSLNIFRESINDSCTCFWHYFTNCLTRNSVKVF